MRETKMGGSRVGIYVFFDSTPHGTRNISRWLISQRDFSIHTPQHRLSVVV